MSKKKKKQLFILIIFIAAIILITIGSTFAYFSATVSSVENAVSMTAAEFKVELTDDTSLIKSSLIPSAELYVDRPGLGAQRRITRKKLILEACNYIMNDERGYDGRLLVAKVLGRDMKNQPNADVEDYLFSIAEKTPEKIIDCYTGGDMQLRMLFIDAKENNVIIKKNGLYLYGENVTLGATDSAVIEWMKSSKNTKTLTLIRQETYSDMFGDDKE
jgi:predicted ribosomally synthesized peptide with SipW-like signal peptide